MKIDDSHLTYESTGLHVDFYEALFSGDRAGKIYESLNEAFVGREKAGNRRSAIPLGDDGIVYEIKFGGYNNIPVRYSRRVALPWDTVPIVVKLKKVVEKLTKQTYNVCIILKYPHGKVGMQAHRDREMIPGGKDEIVSSKVISGMSFGETRKLVLAPTRYIKEEIEPLQMDLGSGSLYVLHPHTNAFWTHSIPKDDTKRARISITFRDYPKPPEGYIPPQIERKEPLVQCAATTKKKNRCNNNATRGSEYCWRHGPADKGQPKKGKVQSLLKF